MRKINELIDNLNWPPLGWREGKCIKIENWESPVKHTPALRLTYETTDGIYSFEDLVFLTPKAIKRIALIASRLCGFDDEVPDKDDDAAIFLSDFIFENAVGKTANILIEEKPETIFIETGPDIGQKKIIMRKKVAFGGYQTLKKEESQKAEETEEETKKDDLPF